ncbi:MAG: AmmeMemoRadiSam system radical SAM enzyme [Candidatus Altiarchaeota archaeon]|nr:AmmeMemoRadiSam system radical SAM enzyme [Candidatus Altiarchaeota archaeon]
MDEAMLYKKESGGRVSCFLCAHACKNIPDGGRGICGVRQNVKGKLYSLVYGKVVAANVDPIEKKPFFNFLPGSFAYSIATAGCNFRCRNCQNSDISQAPRGGRGIFGSDMEPETVVRLAGETGCKSIAYTYTEPTIFFEYCYDISKLAKREGLSNLYVTNGYMSGAMLDEYHKLLDAANVDLKSFRDDFYRDVCGARLEPVLESMKKMKKLGIWLEATTLLIPGMNDSKKELEDIAEFIKKELGSETPWHITRFHPDYRMPDIPATSPEKIHEARSIGLDAGLKYVYAGNLPGDAGENTLCPGCGELLIHRQSYNILENRIKDSRCPSCKTKIDGKF